MPRYKLTIEYDGTSYHGWQRQTGLMSVQQALEEAMGEFTRHAVALYAAGRTDTGVHATGQIAHVDLEKPWKPDKIREATNGLLKLGNHPIAVIGVEEVAADFDARFSALKRHYRYMIINRRAPLTVDLGRAWHVRHPLNVDAMHDAAQVFVGHHDFSTFRSTDCQAKSPMRTVDAVSVIAVSETGIEISCVSRSFLHNQVRSMVGSLRLVGDGKWTKASLKSALNAKARKACGPVAPACGLYLERVVY